MIKGWRNPLTLSITLLSLLFSVTANGGETEMPRKPVLYNLQIYRDAVRQAVNYLLPYLKTNRNALPLGKGPWPLRGHTGDKIGKYKDMSFDSPLVKFEEMTYEERLLLWGYPANQGRNAPLYFDLAQTAYVTYAMTGKWDYEVLPLRNAHIMTMDDLARQVSSLISPVTGKLIEVNHPEFSPGNAYVRVVSEEEVKELVKIDPSIDDWWEYSVLWGGGEKAIPAKDIRVTVTGKEKLVDPLLPPGKHESFIVYVRLYGEKGVLFEGLV